MTRHPSALAPWLEQRGRLTRWAVPALCGALAALSHDGPVIWPLLLGLIPAVLALPARVRAALWHGWWLGLGYFAVSLRWIIEPFFVDPVAHGWMAPFAIVMMAGGLALFWAAGFGVARWLAPGRAGILVVPLVWTLAEWARGTVLTGFPWVLPAYAVIGSPGDVLLAWVGPYGTSLLVLMLVGGVAYCLHRGWTLIWPGLVCGLFAVLGLNALTEQWRGTAPAHDVVVRIVQPNAPQHQKWDPDWMPVFFDRALALTGQGAPADVVIWPETSVPALLHYADPWFDAMAQAARGAPVLAGLQREEAGAYYNALVVIEDDASVAALYDKVHLVPFGEYVPLERFLRPLGLGPMVDQVAGFAPGGRAGLVEVAGLGAVRVLICYEGIFPQEIDTGAGRPDLMVIVTNDAWFGSGPGPRQHLVQAQARAIEQGLPVLRAANTGISAVIDGRGRIVASVPLNEAGALDAAVPAALPVTFYGRMGDIPLLFFIIFSLLLTYGRRHRFTIDQNGRGK